MTFVYPSRKSLYNNTFINGQYPRLLGNTYNGPTLESIESKGKEVINKGLSVMGGPLINKDLERKVDTQPQQPAPQLLATFLPITKNKNDGTVIQNPINTQPKQEEAKEGSGEPNEQLEAERNIKDKIILKETSKVLNRLKKEMNKKPTKSEKKKGNGLISI